MSHARPSGQKTRDGVMTRNDTRPAGEGSERWSKRQRSDDTSRDTRTSQRVQPRSLSGRVTPSPAPSSASASLNGQPPLSRQTPSRETRSFARAPSASRIVTPIAPGGLADNRRQGTAIAVPSLREVTPAPSFDVPTARVRRDAAAANGSNAQSAAAPPPSSSSSSTSLPFANPTLNRAALRSLQPPRGSKPAAPPSAYGLYAKQQRPNVERSAATPSGPRFNVNQAIRQAWNELTSEERLPFEQESQQRKEEYEKTMEAWHEIYGPTTERERRQKSDTMPHKPALPKNAYMLFKEERSAGGGENPKARAGAIASAWQSLSKEQRQLYLTQADLLRQEYDERVESWRQDYPEEAAAYNEDEAGDRDHLKRATVSDDEADYLTQVAQHGQTLSTQRLDVNAVSMADLSERSFKHGRATEKTFELERKLREERRDRARTRHRLRTMRVRTEEELNLLEGRPETESAKVRPTKALHPRASAERAASTEQEEILTDGEGAGTATEGEEGDQSDVESVGAASASTHHTLREKKFSVRTRIVNGQIVLDESSLQQSHNEGAGVSGPSTQFVDVNESDRFVNSATHAKKRGRNDRWQAAETEHFLRAVSMWGSDFEMIARMFPFRDRRQIRAKWRSMEKTNSHSLDLAFKTRIPVDLAVYGMAAGVDLSGEAPSVGAGLKLETLIKKAEEDVEEDLQTEKDSDQQQKAEKKLPQKAVEYDENGLEIVEEGDDEEDAHAPMLDFVARRTRKTSDAAATPMPPPLQTGRRKERAESSSTPVRHARSSSIVSHSGTAISVSAAGAAHGASSAAASNREQKQRKVREEERKQRERARRRAQATGEEEVVEE